MRIERIDCSIGVERKIGRKHGLSRPEVEEAFRSRSAHVRRTTGIYELYGQSQGGRYLLIVFRYLGEGIVRLITARDTTASERRLYKQTRDRKG